MMTDEVWEYFAQNYEKATFRVVPGHWPDFKSKEEVDKWFEVMEKLMSTFKNAKGQK